MTYTSRFKAMKKDLKLTNQDIADITGNTRDSIQVVTTKENKFPRNMKLAVWVWEKLTSINK